MLSVIIPAFNEEEAIGQTLDDLQATLQQAGIVAEIIVVDDGSTDQTGAMASHGARWSFGIPSMSGTDAP